MERVSDCWYKSVCQKECTNSCIRYLEMKYLMDNSNIPKAKQLPQTLTAPKCDIAAFRRLAEIKNNITDFVDCGCNFYIASDRTGNGKTSWAIKLMLKYFDEVWAGNGFRTRALFIHVPSFLLKCKDFSNKDEAFEELKKLLPVVDLVVWDDIAAKTATEFELNQLLSIIEGRISLGKSNIFTSNLSKEAMYDALGSRIASRICNLSIDIELHGRDKRAVKEQEEGGNR